MYVRISIPLKLCLSRTVCGIFSVKEWRDLETGGRGLSRSLNWRRSIEHYYYTTFYYSTIVSIALCSTTFTGRCYASAVYAVMQCPSVRLSVCHVRGSRQNE